MTLTIYVLLRVDLDIEEYIGVFAFLHCAQQRAVELARRDFDTVLGHWQPYGTDAIHAEALLEADANGYVTRYVIQPEPLVLEGAAAFQPSGTASR
jgi:hypothetical protein